MRKHRLIPIFLLLSMTLASGLYYGCNRHIHEPTVLLKAPKTNEGVHPSAKAKPIALPAGYQPMKPAVMQTAIGTPEHPTIDGGIINTTGPIIIPSDRPAQAPSTQNESTMPSNHYEARQIETGHPRYSDEWAMNKKVKQLLIAAASQGKLEYVLKKSDEMGLPASVAVVPMVESHYQTHVVSFKGAAGAWQLMPAVAKEYGVLSKDRFDFVLSTEAALKLLNDLHHQFKNWDLALAAYNAGSQRVSDALRRNPQANTIDELEIPQETKTYVKTIKAINQTLEGMDVHEI